MSEEDKELLARIGQLAGQINRHKNQQAGVRAADSSRPQRQRYNNSRYHGAPYHARGGYRVGRPPAHHHRTLHLNNQRASSESTPSTPGASTESQGWVSKTDRHKQLINANVYEQQAQSRAKAMEETRQRKLKQQRGGEKRRFDEFLRRQSAAAGSIGSGHANDSTNEILVEGVRFVVADGGKKLRRAADESGAAPQTPKTAYIAGIRFHRTKTGNLVADRVVKDQRRSGTVKKVDERCKIFSTTGSCPKGPSCRYQHDPDKVAICKDFLKDGKCANGEFCDLSHEMTPERVPNCLHYAKGHCSKVDCPFTHSDAPPGALVCKAFGYCGYCDKGAECTERHVFECPSFSNTGRCNIKGCKLPHRERASVLRNQARQDESMEDVSSDEEPVDSDDVDSDEVAEFIDADSDESDSETAKDFIPL